MEMSGVEMDLMEETLTWGGGGGGGGRSFASEGICGIGFVGEGGASEGTPGRAFEKRDVPLLG